MTDESTDEQRRRASARSRMVMDYVPDDLELPEPEPMNLEQRYWWDGPDPDPTFSSTLADMEARQAFDYPIELITEGRGGPIPTQDDRQDVASDQPTPGVSD